MSNPFQIEGPAVISFSGGRTSGLMLRRIMDAGLGKDVHILFANTGKEREETLQFVHDCATHWAAPIHWCERPAAGGFVEVDFQTAARRGEPFAALVKQRNFLPNPIMRFCTQELKIRVMRDWMRAKGYEQWTNVVGLRADEPGRVARQMAANDQGRERWEVDCPLFRAGVRKADVRTYWAQQPFDLKLQEWEGNCDLCFLKGFSKKLRVIRDRPDLVTWWQEQEQELRGIDKPSQARFRNDQPTYKKMAEMVRSSPMLPFAPEDLDGDDESIDCFCTN